MNREQIKQTIEDLDSVALLADETSDRLHQAKHRTDDVDAAEAMADAAERASQAWVHATASARILRGIKP